MQIGRQAFEKFFYVRVVGEVTGRCVRCSLLLRLEVLVLIHGQPDSGILDENHRYGFENSTFPSVSVGTPLQRAGR